MKTLERFRNLPTETRNALLKKHGIVMEPTGLPVIKVDLGDAITATIKPSDPMETFSLHSQVRNVHIQNGGELVMVVDAEHTAEHSEGEHDFYLIGENSFAKVPVTARRDLALELAVALRMSVATETRTKKFLSRIPHDHVSKEIVDHILESKPRALDH